MANLAVDLRKRVLRNTPLPRREAAAAAAYCALIQRVRSWCARWAAQTPSSQQSHGTAINVMKASCIIPTRAQLRRREGQSGVCNNT